MSAPAPPPLPPDVRAKGRRTLLLLALVAIAPVVASYTAYYVLPREKRTNYGELLPTAPAPDVSGVGPDGQPFALSQLRGKWVLVVNAAGRCGTQCTQALYATRQARTIQGREMERVQRLWLVTDADAPDPALLSQHPDVQIARVPHDALRSFPEGVERIYLIDPLGNFVLAFPVDPDIKKTAKDIERLLKASRIG